MKKFFKTKKSQKILRWGIVIAVLVVIGIVALQKFVFNQSKDTETVTIQTTKVETRDIENMLESSGTISPLASYDVTTLVKGEIIAADFEVGDTVQEGQVLYKIATDTLDSDIETAETALTRAKKNYTKAEDNYQEALDSYVEAKADYAEAVSKYSDVNVTSSETGIVKNLKVEVGDTIQVGSEIAQIYDNSKMLLTISFSSSDVNASFVGKTAKVTIEDSNETLKGKVTKVSSIEEVLTGNRIVKAVTIEVTNPGGITTSTTADASIGTTYSMNTGTFTVKTDEIITSDLSGEIAYLGIQEGDSITEGNIVLTISQDTVDDALENYSKAVENAQDAIDAAKDSLEEKEEAIEDAQSSLEDVIDSRTDYSIKAPVTGKVISKNMLKGDVIGTSNFDSTLCVIYDLSAVTFSMYVDELDVLEAEEGQDVIVTADALEGLEISGIVTNVSLQSTSSQGVTQYPVTVRIDEVGDLLPGMNVTGSIVIEKSEGVLAIPSQALQRSKDGKEVVYIKDDTVTEVVGEIPAGYKSLEVTTGLTDGDYIEIKSGLTDGQEIYLTKTVTTQSSGLDGLLSSFHMNTTTTTEQQMPSGGMPSGNFQGGGMPGREMRSR